MEKTALEYAKELDAADALASFRQEFYIQPETIYMDGNSLGLLSKRAENTLHRFARFMENTWH